MVKFADGEMDKHMYVQLSICSLWTKDYVT